MAGLTVFPTSHPLVSISGSDMVTSATTETFQFEDTASRNGSDEIWIGAYWASFIEHPDAQQSTVMGVWLRLVVLPVVLFAGFLGNMLTIALMLRPNMRRHSYSPYLLALAACDSFALVIRTLFWVNLLAITLGKPVLVFFHSRPACAAVEYLCTANHVMCSWFIVCLTFERLLVVVFPLKSARLVTVGTSVKVVAGMVVGSLILLSYVPVVVKWVSGSGGCVIQFPQDLQAHFALATTFVSLLPLLLICCGNFVIVVALSQQAQQRRKLMGNNSSTPPKEGQKVTKGGQKVTKNGTSTDKKVLVRQDSGGGDTSDVSVTVVEDSLESTDGGKETGEDTGVALGSEERKKHTSAEAGKKNKVANGNAANSAAKKPTASNSTGGDQQMRRVTVTLLCVCLAFLVLVMPNALLVLAIGLRPDWTGLLPLLDPLALLWDANFAINFYLYVITGGTFRAELLAMLGFRRN